jgi:hypothetical protein
MNFQKLTQNLALSSGLILIGACSGGSGGASAPAQAVSQSPAPTPNPQPVPAPSPAPIPVGESELQVASITGSGRLIVPVSLRQISGKAAASAQFDISFDSTLSLVEVQAGNAATAASKSLQTRALANGMTRVMIVGFDNANTIADGELARLVFDAPANAKARSISLQSAETGSNLAEALKTNVLTGQITTP